MCQTSQAAANVCSDEDELDAASSDSSRRRLCDEDDELDDDVELIVAADDVELDVMLELELNDDAGQWCTSASSYVAPHSPHVSPAFASMQTGRNARGLTQEVAAGTMPGADATEEGDVELEVHAERRTR